MVISVNLQEPKYGGPGLDPLLLKKHFFVCFHWSDLKQYTSELLSIAGVCE